MKIMVVSYDELNKCPSRKQVLSDMAGMYDNASNERLEEMGTEFKNRLASIKSNCDVQVLFADTSHDKRTTVITQIKEAGPDILVTYNLAGYEFSTLTDGIAYNLIDCRQIHFICKERISENIYLNRNLSINMFFENIG